MDQESFVHTTKCHFEWDERKNRQNIKKNGFHFADAEEMFRGALLVHPASDRTKKVLYTPRNATSNGMKGRIGRISRNMGFISPMRKKCSAALSSFIPTRVRTMARRDG